MNLKRYPFPVKLLTIFAWLALWVVAPVPLEAQLFERPTVLEGVYLPLAGGGVSDPVTIVIRRGKVAEMSSQVDVPMLAKRMDVKGLYATAGLVDLSSSLTLGSVSSGDPVHSAWDGFDRYDSDSIRAVIASGVTKIQLQPSGPAGIVGRVSAISLSPREEGGHGILEDEDVALCIDLNQGTPLERIRIFEKVRDAFLAAQRREEGQDEYSEELEEYLEALAEAAKKKAEQGDDKDGEKKDGEKKDGEKKDDAEEGPKKPARLERNPGTDVLLQALRHQLPVRVIARRSQDILNAIDLANEFEFVLHLQGADEAHMVLESLAAVDDLTVLLDVPQQPPSRGGAPRRSPALLSHLEEAGISWAVGSGGESTSLWRAVRAISGGGMESSALSMATSGTNPRSSRPGRSAAGGLRRGASDLVLWTGNPAIDATARPERVIINGTVVWQRPAGTKEGSF
ncbi:MAG: hypothetical protein AAEJ04_03530 [Planctomycetota bacterium]